MFREEALERGENRDQPLLLAGLTNLVAYQSTTRQGKGAAANDEFFVNRIDDAAAPATDRAAALSQNSNLAPH